MKFHEPLLKSIGYVINLGDSNFSFYASMVDTNECRAASTIEALAVSHFVDGKNPHFSFYPVEKKYSKMPPEEQAKSRPFQIVLSDGTRRTGVVFTVSNDKRSHYAAFRDGKYEVDEMIDVRLIEPDAEAYDALIASTNEMNEKAGLAFKYTTIRDFWERYFGKSEYEALAEEINRFNEQANEAIGFNTVVVPTELAIERFREKTGGMLRAYSYADTIPSNVYDRQVAIMRKNYIDRGLWKAMVGQRNFAISFITSEWYYKMHQLSESFDLTWVVAGYLKSVEQLLYAVIELSEGKGVSILAKDRRIGTVEFSKKNEDIIDTTLGALKGVVEHNHLLEVNGYARDNLIETINDWREKKRNGFFHKDVLQSIEQVDEIRTAAIQLYFLILGAFSIRDDQFEQLGIYL